eukprot:COSAG01_NODE_440_length_17033_cov_16.301110_10_plen_71_part_00
MPLQQAAAILSLSRARASTLTGTWPTACPRAQTHLEKAQAFNLRDPKYGDKPASMVRKNAEQLLALLLGV